MDTLEQDASEVLALIRSLKNTFVPVNRIPPEVFSLIPDYCDEDYADQALIALAHVCHGWRDVFTSRSSLWTQLNFTDVDKIQTYIQRSKSSPLYTRLEHIDDSTYLEEVFSPLIPHIRRLKSLSVRGNILPLFLTHLRCHALLLEELRIHNTGHNDTFLDDALHGGNLSSLRELDLRGFATRLPWRNLANLRVLKIGYCSEYVQVTRLLDLFESTPLLHTIDIEDQIPASSDASPARVVPLPCLNSLIATTDSPPSILLNHLSIPTGASLELWAPLDDESPLRDYLPETSPNLKNLSHITMINLRFDIVEKFALPSGPSGRLRLLDHQEDEEEAPYTMDYRTLLSLSPHILSTTERLTISEYRHSNSVRMVECPVFQTLSCTKNLRTFVLSECDNEHFIFSLDPEMNASGFVLCPRLQELALCVDPPCQNPDTKRLISMAKNRAARGVKLSSITIISLGFTSPEAVPELSEYVAHVDYRKGCGAPRWDYIPDESGSLLGM